PEAFDDAVRQYLRDNAHRVAEPADVEAAFAHLPDAVDTLRQAGALGPVTPGPESWPVDHLELTVEPGDQPARPVRVGHGRELVGDLLRDVHPDRPAVLAVLQGDVVVEGDDEALLTGPTAGVDLQDDVGDLLAGHDGIVLRQRPPPLDVVEPHDVD